MKENILKQFKRKRFEPKPKNPLLATKTITIRRDQDEYLQEFDINFSQFIRYLIDGFLQKKCPYCGHNWDEEKQEEGE